MKRRPILAPVTFGAVVFALGSWLAFRALPEWRPVAPLSPSLVETAREELGQAGGRLRQARVQVGSARVEKRPYEAAFRRLGRTGADYIERSGEAVARVVDGELDVTGLGSGGVTMSFDAAGRPRAAFFWPGDSVFPSAQASESHLEDKKRFVDGLEARLAGGRRFAGRESTYSRRGALVVARPLEAVPGEPLEAVVTMDTPTVVASHRTLADVAPTSSGWDELARWLPAIALALVVAVAFGVLLFRRRIGARIAFVVSSLAFLSMALGGLGPEYRGGGAFVLAITVTGHILQIVFLAVLWMVAESLLRDTVPGFTTSLDALAYGRLGPRAGRALVAGLGLGAAVAGLRLAASGGAALLADHGVRPTARSFSLPLFAGGSSPFYEGAFLTGLLVLAIALLRFVMQRQRAEVVASVVFALYVSLDTPLAPWGAAFAASLAVGTTLLFAFQRYGFASLLVAATSAALFRDTLAAIRLAPHETAVLLGGSAALLTLAIAGVVGLRRAEREEEGRIDAPEYVRRLESERRVKYEMDLLTRMQLALLPEKPPAVDGLEIGVRSVLATEAGGDLYDFAVEPSGALWIAAGDVSGHGYSCGIQQAMVKAAFMSLARDGRPPSQVLAEIDRVLRTGGKTRLFTSLTLLRLDPESGQGLLANAGHPFPLLLAGGTCTEIAASGLPLGQGPPRIYADVPIELPAGGVLVLASDGLYEGPDRFDAPYGYERPRQVLTAVGLFRRPATAILEALLADWRLHVGEGAPADDTTVLVVKRPNLFA